jgi:cyclopropane fatty-acyl-phospholipid synthase-like methyltransferase
MTLLINQNGYWETANDAGHVHDTNLCVCIYEFLRNNNINSLLDLGCGTGDYCKYFLNQNIMCDAYDGNPNTPIISNGIGKVLDLSNDCDLNKMYDCVLSLEVGEHIPKQYEDIFINNVCKHSSKWIILSWAIVGQAGNGHVNCQNNDYIIDKLEKNNFSLQESHSKYLRENSIAPWFKNTIMVFKKMMEI